VTTCLCCSGPVKKSGLFQNRNGNVQRFKCLKCAKSFSETQPLDGIRIDREEAVQVVEMLAETVSVRAAARLSRLEQGTILRILDSAGKHCARLLDDKVRNVNVTHVQVAKEYSDKANHHDKAQVMGLVRKAPCDLGRVAG